MPPLVDPGDNYLFVLLSKAFMSKSAISLYIDLLFIIITGSLGIITGDLILFHALSCPAV